MNKGLARPALLILALLGIGLMLSGGASSLPLSTIPNCTLIRITKCRWIIDINGRPRPSTLNTAVSNDAVLNIYNTGTGGLEIGLYASAENYGVYGDTDSGTGVRGDSTSGYGVYGNSSSGTGVLGHSSSGVPVIAEGNSSTNLIEAWDLGALPDNLRFRVALFGNVYADGTYYGAGGVNAGSADIAERIDTLQTLEPGDVVEIDPDNPGHYRISSSPNSTLVAGIISTSPAMTMGNDFDPDTEDWEDDRPSMAMVGTVPVKVTAENGPINAGDLLTSSSLPGYAMRASPITIQGYTFYLPGTILGKALEPLEEGTGTILVLITLQ